MSIREAISALTLQGSETDVMHAASRIFAALITAGRLVPVLTVGHKRSKLLPDVSSAEEAGLPRLEHKGWSGFRFQARQFWLQESRISSLKRKTSGRP